MIRQLAADSSGHVNQRQNEMSEPEPLVSLYRNAQIRQGDDFAAFALGWLDTQLHFDAGAIVTSLSGHGAYIAAHFHGYADAAALFSGWGPGNPFNRLSLRLSAKPLTAYSQDVDSVGTMAGLPLPAGEDPVRAGMLYSAGVAVPTDAGCSTTFLVLTRQRKNQRFTRQCLKHLERLAPQVTEALAVSRSMALLRSPNHGIGGMPVALVDREGRFVQTTHAFNQLFWSGAASQVTHLEPECLTAIRKGGAWPLLIAGASHCLYGLAENGGWYLVIRPASRLERLSERERGLAQLFARGVTRKDIARQLGLSPSTVKNHLSNIYRKLGIKDRVALIRAVQDGAIPASSSWLAAVPDKPLHSSGSKK